MSCIALHYDTKKKNLIIKIYDEDVLVDLKDAISHIYIKNKTYTELFIHDFELEQKYNTNNLHDVWYALSLKYVY
jgi:hypothetical protein